MNVQLNTPHTTKTTENSDFSPLKMPLIQLNLVRLNRVICGVLSATFLSRVLSLCLRFRTNSGTNKKFRFFRYDAQHAYHSMRTRSRSNTNYRGKLCSYKRFHCLGTFTELGGGRAIDNTPARHTREYLPRPLDVEARCYCSEHAHNRRSHASTHNHKHGIECKSERRLVCMPVWKMCDTKAKPTRTNIVQSFSHPFAPLRSHFGPNACECEWYMLTLKRLNMIVAIVCWWSKLRLWLSILNEAVCLLWFGETESTAVRRLPRTASIIGASECSLQCVHLGKITVEIDGHSVKPGAIKGE